MFDTKNQFQIDEWNEVEIPLNELLNQIAATVDSRPSVRVPVCCCKPNIAARGGRHCGCVMMTCVKADWSMVFCRVQLQSTAARPKTHTRKKKYAETQFNISKWQKRVSPAAARRPRCCRGCSTPRRRCSIIISVLHLELASIDGQKGKQNARCPPQTHFFSAQRRMSSGQRRGSTMAADVQGIVSELKARGAEVRVLRFAL